MFDEINGKFIEVTNYSKDNEVIQVEIGDTKQIDFYPQIKMIRWDNEVNFSLRLDINDNDNVSFASDNNTVSWNKGSLGARFYRKPDTKQSDRIHNEYGAHEFEIVFADKPSTNVVRFTMRSKNLTFHKQYATKESDIELFYANRHDLPADPSLKDATIEEVRKWVDPEEIVGSYAVMHSTKRNNKYKTGQAFMLYRPYVTDFNLNKAWCDLDIDINAEIATVTIPQSFLDNAIYPVVLDPTFGNTSHTGTYVGCMGAPWGLSGVWTMGAVDGTVTDGAWYGYAGLGQTGTFYIAFWNSSTDAVLFYSSTASYDANGGWFTNDTFGGTDTLSASTSYRMGVVADHVFYMQAPSVGGYSSEVHVLQGWPTPITWAGFATDPQRNLPIYVNYDEAASGPANIAKLNSIDAADLDKLYGSTYADLDKINGV